MYNSRFFIKVLVKNYWLLHREKNPNSAIQIMTHRRKLWKKILGLILNKQKIHIYFSKLQYLFSWERHQISSSENKSIVPSCFFFLLLWVAHIPTCFHEGWFVIWMGIILTGMAGQIERMKKKLSGLNHGHFSAGRCTCLGRKQEQVCAVWEALVFGRWCTSISWVRWTLWILFVPIRVTSVK